MPIRELANRSIDPPRLGIIRKGDPKIKKTNAEGKEYEVVGRDRDTFRVVFDKQYKSFEPIFTDMYTDAPVEFRNIMLLGDTPNTIFESWYEEHKSATLLHRCDGVEQAVHFVGGEYLRDQAACENKKLHPEVAGKGCNCNERGWLKIVLMDFTIASGVWGYFQVETGSIYDIIALTGYLSFIDSIQNLRGLRFVLGRSPKMVSTRDPKDPSKRNKREMNLLYLMVEPEQTKQYLVEAVNQRDQLALSGRVNLETGELNSPALLSGDEPFVPPQYQLDAGEIDSLTDWDVIAVQEATSHLFKHPAHQDNTIHKLQEDGIITSDMTTEDVIAIIKSNRADRRDEKLTTGEWWKDADLVKEFCSAVNRVTQLQAGQILKAIAGDSATRFSQVTDMPREKAWALCLIYAAEGDYEAAKIKANDDIIVAWIDDLWIASLPQPDTSGDIPF